jgi:hypothetical protein
MSFFNNQPFSFSQPTFPSSQPFSFSQPTFPSSQPTFFNNQSTFNVQPPYNLNVVENENKRLQQEIANLKLETQLQKAQIESLEKRLKYYEPSSYVSYSLEPSKPPITQPIYGNCNTCGLTAYDTCEGKPYGEVCGKWLCSTHLTPKWHRGREYLLCGKCHHHHTYYWYQTW